jgi:hypothetical protein
MSESRTLIELSDTDLDHVSGGITGLGFFVLVEGNGKINLHANSPNTPANGNGFNGNGAQIVFVQ